jgi:negative regulator of replication initiation
MSNIVSYGNLSNYNDKSNIIKLEEYANNFLVFYYTAESTMFEESTENINRIFNIYMKKIILSSKLDIYDMESLLLFINNLGSNDKYRLKSAANISNLIKYLLQAKIILINNKIICEELNNLMIYILQNNIHLKQVAYINLIEILENNLKYIEKHYTVLINKHGLSHSKFIGFGIHERVEILTLYVYNNILEIISKAIKYDYIWLDYNSINSLNYIIRLRLFFFRKNLILANSMTHKFILYDLNYQNFRTNSIIQKEKIRLRNIIIEYEKQTIKKAINKFIRYYQNLVNTFIKNTTELNIFIDGRNIFYCKNENTFNIDLNKIVNFDQNIIHATTTIYNKLYQTGIINDKNRDKKINYYLIFNENYREILNNLRLEKSKILFTPMGTNDDIFQLYLWLSYSGCILISNDKHSDFINKINENVYLKNLFLAIKSDFQYTF